MWRDVFLNNRESVLEMLQRFSEDLTALQRAIRWGEGEALESLFRRTREIRRGVIEAHQAGSFDAREPERSGLKGSVTGTAYPDEDCSVPRAPSRRSRCPAARAPLPPGGRQTQL